MYVDMIHSSANNGHPPPHHPPHHPPASHPPPPSHLDSRYMDYATAAMAAAPHHTAHLGPHDPHALHYAAAVSLPPQPHVLSGCAPGSKRHPEGIGMDHYGGGGSSDDEGSMDVKPPIVANQDRVGAGRGQSKGGPDPTTGKKTKGRVKIKMEFIDNKLRRYTTFSKRKTGIMKKAYELSTLTGTQVMLLVASETGHVYTFATRKLQPMITSDAGKALIQTCLNSPDPPPTVSTSDQRMSATGYEETELTYNIADDEQQKDESDQEDDDELDAEEGHELPDQRVIGESSKKDLVLQSSNIEQTFNFRHEEKPVKEQRPHEPNPKEPTSSAKMIQIDTIPQNVLQNLIAKGRIIRRDGSKLEALPSIGISQDPGSSPSPSTSGLFTSSTRGSGNFQMKPNKSAKKPKR